MEKEFEKIILSLTEAIQKEDKQKYEIISNELTEQLLKSPYDLREPENYHIMFQFQLNTILENAVSPLHKTKDSSVRDKHKAQFIYLNYSYLSRNIEKLVKMRMGTSAYSVDVSRTIIEMYLEYSLTESIPETDYEEHYWLPRFGENEDWMDFCDGLYLLYYGHNELYLNTLKVLMESKIRRYKHIRHKHIITFNNGFKIEIGNTYDDKTDYNLEEENDCYLIPKIKVTFENQYQTTKKLWIDYYMVPKTEIKEMNKESEPIFL